MSEREREGGETTVWMRETRMYESVKVVINIMINTVAVQW